MTGSFVFGPESPAKGHSHLGLSRLSVAQKLRALIQFVADTSWIDLVHVISWPIAVHHIRPTEERNPVVHHLLFHGEFIRADADCFVVTQGFG